MDDLFYVYAIAALMIGTLAIQVVRKAFDPFAPLWLFLVGYGQVYVIQAISYHEWAVRVRGAELVGAANLRSLWAIAWFFLVYFLAPCRFIARSLPKPPPRWSSTVLVLLCPVLMLWGVFCAVMVFRLTTGAAELTAEGALAISFPLLLLVAGILMVVTGHRPERPSPALVWSGMAVVGLYMLIWMFNGKRSHSLIAVLTGVCVFYTSKRKRPSFPILVATALVGASAVGVSIGWRYYTQRSENPPTLGEFAAFIAEFDPSSVLESLNIKEHSFAKEDVSYETEEYGASLLMQDTVPSRSDYDYGAPYLRVFTTFIPRLVWPNKPLPGREQWTAAWVAGSEFTRDMTFTGPAIGILGAAHLNGGALGTFVVMGIVAFALRSGYDYFRLHAGVPWVQAWWALTYYNAWFCTVNDDPLNWFYYNWGFTTMPTLVLLWVVNRSPGTPEASGPEAVRLSDRPA